MMLARKIITSALVLMAISSSAVAVDEPAAGGDKTTLFVGHYGEVLKLRSVAMRIEPEMHGPVEVVNYYPDFRIDLPDGEPFHAKPSDWNPENFSRFGLVQLIIMPRGRSLVELKRAKIDDLRSSGVEFKVIENPYGPILGQWPEGSFEILVTKPCRLSQLYTATSSQLCILTSGVDVPPSTMIESYSRSMRSALAEWVVPLAPRREEILRHVDARGTTWRFPVAWMIWAGISGMLALLVVLLGAEGRWKVLRRFSLWILIFSNGGALVGGFAGLALRTFPWSAHHWPAAPAAAVVLLPVLAWLGAKRREARFRRRILAGTGVWALVAALVLGYLASFDWGYEFSLIPVLGTVLSFAIFGVGGAIFALLDPGKKNAAAAASLLLLLILPANGRAQAGALDANARQRLEATGVSEKSLEDQAKINLRRTQVIYDYQRVEMKGIWSSGSNTNATWNGIFDLQLEPTHTGRTDDSVMIPPVWAQKASAHLKDLIKLRQDAYNEITNSAIDAIAQLKDKEVNEIVAHSWGTEIIYNAILAGEIRAPRRLIVAGMPDRDKEKWMALSRHTGTEVIVYTNSHDPAAESARFLGALIDNVGAAISPDAALSVMSANKDRWERQWSEACRKLEEKGESCNPHGRRAEAVYRDDYLKASHDRMDYYQAMIDRHDLPNGTKERDQPAPGSAWALQDAQNAKVIREARRLYAAALNRERRVIEAESINGDASFVAGVGQIQTMSKEAKLALERQVHADELADEQVKLAALRAARDARVEDSRRVWAQIEREDRAKKYVQSLAGEACSNPDRMSELATGHGVLPVTDLLPPDVSSSYGTIETSGPGSLSSCQMAVLDRFDAARRRREGVTSKHLAQWAKQYREANPSLVAKIRKAIGGFFSAFGDLLEVPVESARPSSSAGGQSRGVEPQRREEKQCFDTYIPELNQTIRACSVY